MGGPEKRTSAPGLGDMGPQDVAGGVSGSELRVWELPQGFEEQGLGMPRAKVDALSGTGHAREG